MNNQNSTESLNEGAAFRIQRGDNASHVSAVVAAGKRAYAAGFEDGYKAARQAAKSIFRQRVLGFLSGVGLSLLVTYVF